MSQYTISELLLGWLLLAIAVDLNDTHKVELFNVGWVAYHMPAVWNREGSNSRRSLYIVVHTYLTLFCPLSNEQARPRRGLMISWLLIQMRGSQLPKDSTRGEGAI